MEPVPDLDLATPLVAWYRENARDLPWRRPAFHARYGGWGVLVSEFMLQQTPTTRVIPHLDAWLARWPTPADLAADPPAAAVRQWANLGYPRRALWLHRAAVQPHALAVGLHGQLLQICRETHQVLRIGQHRMGSGAEEIAVPDTQQPQDHRRVLLERGGAEVLVHQVEPGQHLRVCRGPDRDHQ